MNTHQKDVSFVMRLISEFSKNVPLFPRLQSADILTTGGIAESSTTELFSTLESDTINAKHNNLWTYKDNLPPDIDDTVSAFDFLSSRENKDHFKRGEIIGEFIKVLRTTCISNVGSGPYYTWIIDSKELRWKDVDYIVNANIVNFLSKNGSIPDSADKYITKIAHHELNLSGNSCKDFIEENTRYYKYRGFRHYLLWRWAKNTNSPLLPQLEVRALKLESIFDLLIISNNTELLSQNLYQIKKTKTELINYLRDSSKLEDMPLMLRSPLYVERIKNDTEEFEQYPVVTLSALLVIAQKIEELENATKSNTTNESKATNDDDIQYINEDHDIPPRIHNYLKFLIRGLNRELNKMLRKSIKIHFKSSSSKWIRNIITSISKLKIYTIRQIIFLEATLHLGWIAMSSRVRKNTNLSVILHLLSLHTYSKINRNSLEYIKQLSTNFIEAYKHTLKRADIFAHIIDSTSKSKICGKVINHLLTAKLLHDNGKDYKYDKSAYFKHNRQKSFKSKSIALKEIATNIIKNINNAEKLSKNINLDCNKVIEPLKYSALKVIEKHSFYQGILKTVRNN